MAEPKTSAFDIGNSTRLVGALDEASHSFPYTPS